MAEKQIAKAKSSPGKKDGEGNKGPASGWRRAPMKDDRTKKPGSDKSSRRRRAQDDEEAGERRRRAPRRFSTKKADIADDEEEDDDEWDTSDERGGAQGPRVPGTIEEVRRYL